MATEPLEAKYAGYSPYIYALNNPISFIDIDGRDVYFFDNKNRLIAIFQDGEKSIGYRITFLDTKGAISKSYISYRSSFENDIELFGAKYGYRSPDVYGCNLLGVTGILGGGYDFGLQIAFFNHGPDRGGWVPHLYAYLGFGVGMEASFSPVTFFLGWHNFPGVDNHNVTTASLTEWTNSWNLTGPAGGIGYWWTEDTKKGEARKLSPTNPVWEGVTIGVEGGMGASWRATYSWYIGQPLEKLDGAEFEKLVPLREGTIEFGEIRQWSEGDSDSQSGKDQAKGQY